MARLNQFYTKHMIIYFLIGCLFQVSSGRAAPEQQTVTVDIPDAEGIIGNLTNRAKSMANRFISAYTDSADMATESGKNVMAFFQKMNESAQNFGTNTANRMGEMVKNGNRSWSGLLTSLFSSN
ncbi:uncharacterized protein LOC132924410 [Rhopalosiphum padi]|uniref:uncharacterized protein LOC132924410 n=1 Tax=Rhopalosiphum padi TaxID=40932 RepID=UPI00298E3B2C|nr:uncharacterized protein LOC132924410 [Rhopalosiphum padi]